jgi:hypothetical protein
VWLGENLRIALHGLSAYPQLFRRAQHSLSSNNSITLPQPNDVLWIVTNGALRKRGLGVTYYVSRNSKVLLAGLFSEKLRSGQVLWLPCEIEALSVAAAVNHFSPYIVQSSTSACVLTDSKPYVQAFEKRCRGEFSASPRVSTFLSTSKSLSRLHQTCRWRVYAAVRHYQSKCRRVCRSNLLDMRIHPIVRKFSRENHVYPEY